MEKSHLTDKQEVELTIAEEALSKAGLNIQSRMSLACSLGLHNWNRGKRCVNCGATRGR